MTDVGPEATVAGAQTVDRACLLLREIARAGSHGARMLDLCATSGLSRPTAHRILRSLQQARLVCQREGSRRYALGGGLFELGLAVPSPLVRFPQVRSVVEELAASTEDTVYLMLRSYDDVVCLWRAQGAYPIKANVVALGDRRPLGASVAGLCILAGMPDEESRELIGASRAQLRDFCRMDAPDVVRHVQAARSAGYSVGVHAVMEGVTAVGMAVPAFYGRPSMAMSVSAIASRIPPERIPDLVARLTRATVGIAGITGAR